MGGGRGSGLSGLCVGYKVMRYSGLVEPAAGSVSLAALGRSLSGRARAPRARGARAGGAGAGGAETKASGTRPFPERPLQSLPCCSGT